MSEYRAYLDCSIEELKLLIIGVSKLPESEAQEKLLTKLLEERMRSIRRTEKSGLDFTGFFGENNE